MDQIEAEFPDILDGAFSYAERLSQPTDGLIPIDNSRTPKSATSQRKEIGPRVFASQERVYHAVCGHEPDSTRVSELEFSLLCTIGAARHDGILQGELGRVTKQDKRSVPKRTDTLHSKGYVEKQAAYHRGHKTSRIFLRRFAHTQVNSDTIESSPRLVDLARQILTVVKDNTSSTQDGLASTLSVSDPAKRRVLTQVVQYLIRKGCLEEVETASAPDSASNDLLSTLRFVRALDDPDRNKVDNGFIDLDTPLESAVDMDEDTTELEGNISLPEPRISQIVSRPDWNPDRALPNMTSLPTFEDIVSRGSSTWSDTDGGVGFANCLNTDSTSRLLGVSSTDGFGFSKRSKPSQQVNSGRATIEDIANVPGPSAAVIVRPGEAMVATGEAGDIVLSATPDYVGSRSSPRPNTPQLPSCIVTLKLKPGSMPAQPGMTQRQQTTPTKPKAKPQKFMQGTKKFWQHIFQLKKLEANPALARGRGTGLMNDPKCLQMFAEQPKDFDDTLMKALGQDLPLPYDPVGINETWVNKTKAFLNRTRPGVYYVPSGVTDLQQPTWSCPVIIKSYRLSEVVTTNRYCHAQVLFLSSSAAHTSGHHRIFQWYSSGVKKVSALSKYLPARTIEADQAVVTATTVQQQQKEQTVGEKNDLKSTMEATSPEVRDSAEPKSQPLSIPSMSKFVYPSSPAKQPQRHHERVQRQRRPTRKALESAQLSMSNEPGLESSSSSAAFPGDAGTVSENARISFLSPPKNASFPVDTIATAPDLNAATDTAAADEIGAQILPAISQENNSSPPNPSKVESLPINQSAVSEQIQGGLMYTGDVQTTNKSYAQTSTADTSLVGPEARTHSPTSLDGATSAIDADPSRLHDLEVNNQARSATEGPGTLQSSLEDTDMAASSGELTLLTGKDAVPYYRKFLVELVYMCGGVVPYDASLLKRAMGPKTVEAHVETNMNIKLIKTSINALLQSGKLKTMQFAFQKNGFSHTKAILALPSTQPCDQSLTSMQTRISLLPANIDYVPPELEIEAARRPQGILRTEDPPSRESKAKSKAAASTRPKRPTSQSVDGRRGGGDLGRQFSPASTPPYISPNTGFLTLKVPKIAHVQTDQAFTSNYFNLPAQPLIVDSDLRNGGSQTASPMPASLRRNSTRDAQRFGNSTAIRKVQWRIPKCTPLPKSLRAILAYDSRINAIDHALSINPALETFDRDVDFVATWEQKNLDDLQDPKPREWNFINHLSFKKEFIHVRPETELQFCLVTFNELHEEVETELPEAESWKAFADVVSKEAMKLRKAAETKLKRKRKAQDELVEGRSDNEDEDGYSDFMSSDGEAPKKKRQRGPNHKWRRKPRIAGTELDRRRQKRNYVNPRGIGLRDIPKTLAHRITTAIVVVRVLTGGLDKYLDWKLVARLIPGEPESMLQSRWRTLSTRYNNDFDAMVLDLQTKYLDALADDKVPSVNYNDLPGTNWEGIFEWAVANVNAEGKGAPVTEVPPNREEFLELYTAEVGEPTSVRPLHNSSLQYTVATKEDFWCSMVSGTNASSLPEVTSKAIEPIFPTEDEEAAIVLARARSWVFAAVMTPHQSFTPQAAHEKLRKLAEDQRECEQLIETTLKKLQNDKMVVTKDSADAVIVTDGTTLSGTYDWKLSTRFLDRFDLNRHVTSNMLKQAVKYKAEVLDPNFAVGDVVIIPGDPFLEDGVMVAIFNLMNAGMLQLEPGTDMPATRYGIDGESEGYKTRSMDKRNLYFSTILRPTPSYVQGDPSISDKGRVDIPRGDMDQVDGLGLIPMWFDINHDFRSDVWDMVVGAITGLISCRPGVSTLELVRTFGYAISQRDMGMIVQYLYDCKMIEKTRSGWETTEIWWFAIGTGTDNGVQGSCV